MKVALVHDYIKEYGGAERVLEALHDLFPKSPVYTTVYAPEYLGPHKERFASWNIRTSWLQHIPFAAKLISPMRLIAPSVFRHMDLSSYDVIIVSATGAYTPNLVHKGKAKLICYCHTPPRYLYGYATARNWKKNPFFRVMGEFCNHFLRIVDYESSQNVDWFIANSKEVSSRIKKFYRKDSIVIYPPVDLPRAVIDTNHPRTYFLTGGRLAAPKHLDIAIAACTKLGLPLKVFGKGFAGYGEALKKIAGKTIEFVGEITDKEKQNLMAGAKAFLFPSEDEDFGIVPVEAMACGTPVIAYRSGGVMETVIEGKTGLFFDDLTVASLSHQIKQFEKSTTKWSSSCVLQSKRFEKRCFDKEFLKTLVN
jgi:glycosyltransferase involved in cell wall biosynthesis